ncbi:hypothetical protein [Streptomyces sp. NPDC058751]
MTDAPLSRPTPGIPADENAVGAPRPLRDPDAVELDEDDDAQR